uniref:Uncharacterized protein n=1 Tax=Schistosoma haematobium TaxID=6185 RepID=A0A094ZY95_SCHHA
MDDLTRILNESEPFTFYAPKSNIQVAELQKNEPIKIH